MIIISLFPHHHTPSHKFRQTATREIIFVHLYNTKTSFIMSKQVAFSDIEIREYPYVLGDNPACSSGAPLTIGWKVQDSYTRNVDVYEFARKNERKRKAPRVSVQRRAQILLSSGYSIEQIGSAVLLVDEIKKMRSDSLKSTGLGDRTKMLLETTGRLPKDILTGMAGLLTIKPTKTSITARSA